MTPKHLYYAGILRLLGEGGGGNGSPQHHPLQVFPLKAAQPLGAPPRTAASGVAPGAALGSAESIDLLRELQGMGDGGWGGQEHRPRVLLSRTPPTHPSVPTPSVPPPIPTCSSAQGLCSSWGSAQHVVVTASSSCGTGRLWEEGVRNGGPKREGGGFLPVQG